MLSLAGSGTASTARKSVGTVEAALAELLAELVGLDAGAGVVAALARVLAGLVVVLVASRPAQLGLDLAVVLGPRPGKG